MTRTAQLTVLVALAVMLAHAVLVRGYIGLWWGDDGLWRHQVERLAVGESLYRDVYVAVPPLGFWVVGAVARLVGSDLAPLFVVTAAISLMIATVWGLLVARVVPGGLAVLAAVAGMTAAIGYSTIMSAPIPLGMYSPAAPVGGLWMLSAVIVTVFLLQRRTSTTWLGTSIGVLAGLCFLTKQDFWAPALVLVGVACWHGTARFTLPALFVVAGGGIAVVAWTAGSSAAVGMLTGFGLATENGLARGLPSWSRLTLEVAALNVALAVGFAAVALERGWTAARMRWVGGALGLALVLAQFFRVMSPAMLQREAIKHAFPVLLPVIALGVLVWRWRDAVPDLRVLAAVLLSVCVAARLRRGFEFAEWYQVLLEVPAYLVAAKSICGTEARRSLAVGLVVVLVAGTTAYWTFGVGPFTARGAYQGFDTPRGRVYWRPNEVEDYKKLRTTLSELDSGGPRPLFAFGHNGGYHYFLVRQNRTPLQQGFTLLSSNRPEFKTPERAVQTLRADPSPILLYNRAFAEGRVPEFRLAWDRWEQPTRLSHYARDLPYFDALREGCPSVAAFPANNHPFVVYDCARP